MLYRPKKSLGQNFMMSEEVALQMVKELDLSSHDTVVEIGPGLGAVTQFLSESLFEFGSKIYAIEIDSRFVPKLEEMFRGTINVKVIEADILDWLPKQHFEGDYKILGALPFYITSPILHMLVKVSQRPVRSVLLLQKEVGEKITAIAPDASYLSTFLQTFFEVSYVTSVPKSVFKPVPKVDGAIVTLERKSVDPVFMDSEVVRKYEGFLHRGFSSPRKMLNKPFKSEELASVGVDPSLRPQNLDVATWIEMFKTLVLQ